MTVLFLLAPLEHVFRSVLNWLHGTIGLPWAWSIIALTVIVRMILVPLTVKQIHSMQSMQRHAPQMKEIQRKYKGDRQKMNEELMKFYKENSINPAASCLPFAFQIPVFIGLYYTLRAFSREDVRLHPGSLAWLHFVPDISKHTVSHWSGYLLLLVYAASQIASTLLMGTTMDKTQKRIMLVLPLAFIFVVARFPAGLVLYWMTTNLWTVGQGLITRRLVPKTPPPSLNFKRSSRAPAADGDKPVAEKQTQAAPMNGQPQPPRRVKRKKKARR